jgi:hypothetical protein
MNTTTTEMMAATPVQRSLIDVEQSRAMQQVQGQILAAKRDPRDTTAAYTRIMKQLERPSLAEKALYSYPRGGQIVSGASIRLGELLAQNYGNIDAGIRELERREGRSICEAYCWDLETNFRMTRQFEVAHIRDTKQGPKKLTDERDIDEMVLNKGARRMRACILAIIPADIVEDSIERCRKVMSSKESPEPLKDRINKIVLAFATVGVTQEMIEERLGHPIQQIIHDQIPDLQGIYNSLKDKTAKREKFFSKKSDTAEILKSSPAPEPAPIPQDTVDEQHRQDMLKKVMDKIQASGIDQTELVVKIGMPFSMLKNQDIRELTRIYGVLK